MKGLDELHFQSLQIYLGSVGVSVCESMNVCVYSVHIHRDRDLICDLPPDLGDLDGLGFG